jgi:hypothetical protein
VQVNNTVHHYFIKDLHPSATTWLRQCTPGLQHEPTAFDLIGPRITKLHNDHARHQGHPSLKLRPLPSSPRPLQPTALQPVAQTAASSMSISFKKLVLKFEKIMSFMFLLKNRDRKKNQERHILVLTLSL